MNLGIIRGESLADYHSSPAVSSTRLMDLRPSPAFFHMRHIAKTVPKGSSAAFDLGNAAHSLILEGRAALEARTVLQPEFYDREMKGGIVVPKPWHNGADYCKQWNKEQEWAGKVILTSDDFATIDKMAAAVAENPDAMALLTGGESELTFRVQHPAFSVQCRADMFHDRAAGYFEKFGERNVCVDLKTCDSIEQFRAHYFAHRYYYRAAFYLDVIEQVTGERPAFFFVAVEKNAPFRCEVFEPSESDLELGRNEMLADLKTLRRCIEKNEWPNSRLGVQTIELTSWQRKMSEDRSSGLFEEAGVA